MSIITQKAFVGLKSFYNHSMDQPYSVPGNGNFWGRENFGNDGNSFLYFSEAKLSFDKASACCQLCHKHSDSLIARLAQPRGESESKAIADFIGDGPLYPPASWIGIQTNSGEKYVVSFTGC